MWRLWRIFTTSASLSEMQIILFLYFVCYLQRFFRLLDYLLLNVLSKFDIFFNNLGPRKEELLDPVQVEEIIANHQEPSSSSASVIRARQVTRSHLDSDRAPENILLRYFHQEVEIPEGVIMFYVLGFHYCHLDLFYRILFKELGEKRIFSYLESFTPFIGCFLLFSYKYWRRKIKFELDENVIEAERRESVLRSVLLLPHFKFHMTRFLKTFRYYLILVTAIYLYYWAVQLHHWQNQSSFCELIAEPADSIGIFAVHVGFGYLAYYMFDIMTALLFTRPPYNAFVK